jgi:hypothetical protein
MITTSGAGLDGGPALYFLVEPKVSFHWNQERRT